jgi:hypothetical protein
MGDNLHLLAHSTAINILPDISAHTRPPVGFLHIPFGGMSRVSGGRVIMMELENAFAEISEDISMISVKQNTISKMPVGESRLHRGAQTPFRA